MVTRRNRSKGAGRYKPQKHLPMNLGHIQAEKAAEGGRTFRRTTNDRRTVSEAIDDAVAALLRSGAMDTYETEMLAVDAVAQEFRLTLRQAEAVWIGCTTPNDVLFA